MLALIGACNVLTILTVFLKTLPAKRKVALILLEVSAMCLLIADRYSHIYDGNATALGYYMVRASNFGVFFFSIFLLFSFSFYLSDIVRRDFALSRPLRRLLLTRTLAVFGILVLICSQFNGFYYTFDAQNLYHRGVGFIFCYVVPLAMMTLQISVIVEFRKKFSRPIFAAMLIFTTFPLAATLVQIFAYGVSFTNMSLAFDAALFYIFVIIDFNQKLEESRTREIEALKNEQYSQNIMFSQIAEALASAIDAKDTYTHGHNTPSA